MSQATAIGTTGRTYYRSLPQYVFIFFPEDINFPAARVD